MTGYRLEFEGYRELPPADAVSASGIYCIYAGNPATDSSVKLIYIGQTEELKMRLSSHEKMDEWRRKADHGSLYYSFAELDEADLDDVEWAMIYEHKPICNDKCTKNPPDNLTTVTVDGDKVGLNQKFTCGKM